MLWLPDPTEEEADDFSPNMWRSIRRTIVQARTARRHVPLPAAPRAAPARRRRPRPLDREAARRRRRAPGLEPRVDAAGPFRRCPRGGAGDVPDPPTARRERR